MVTASKSRPVTVCEIDPFAATAKKAGLTEAERAGLTDFLARNPEAGDVIEDTGGLRKVRWAKAGAGKRGGYRAIYYFFDVATPIFLLAIYPKNQQENLTPEQKKRLTNLAADLKSAAKRMRARTK